jgi:nitrogen fixation/metabolism regulation signal transduction histidine kinase
LVFDDVTELLQAQRDAAWGEVARRLAHEIKNPLTPIQLSAERIRKKYLTGEAVAANEPLDRATMTIVQQVEAMRDMVNAFSEYARAPELNLTELNLNQLISQVVDLYPAHGQRPKPVLKLDESLPNILVDAVRMRQVLHNLIRNALEALEGMEEPNILVETHLLVDEPINWIEISISDNGPGFSEDDQGKAFEPYVTTKEKGTGLGLAIVKKLIDEHGGEISIANEAVTGARINIKLPLTATNAKPADNNEIRRKSA